MIDPYNLKILIAITGWVFIGVFAAYSINYFRLSSWIRSNTKEDRVDDGFNFFLAHRRALSGVKVLMPSRLPEFVQVAKKKDLYVLRLLLISFLCLFCLIITLGVLQTRLAG